MVAGILVRKYVGKVEHFIVAGREMNVYLGIASLAATEFGVVTCMYTAQNGYDKGFSGAIPGICMAVPMLIVGLTGFCIKPLRDRGVMTIPEFFQERFGSKIRWMGGVVIVLGGLLNMGVFLRKGGEFLVYCTGMNPHSLEWVMTALLLGVAVYTILGGMLSVLVTDYLQFVVMSVGLIVVTILILVSIGWTTLVNTVQTHYGAGGFNPFVGKDMGWQFVVSNAIMNFAVVLTWQTTVARVLAAKNSKTGQRIYTATSFFFVARFLIPGIWGIAALATLSAGAVDPKNTILAMPVFLSTFVPAGLMGLLVAAMLAADMSTDSSYMLTWASVIYNDILAPFRRRRPWSERKGLMINRLIVAGIGVFLLIFGLWYELKGSLWDYLMITATIYLSSMSVMLIACCYWRRANSWGAAGAIILGAAIPLTFLVLKTGADPATFWTKPVVGYYAGMAAFGLAALAMIVGSLLKPPGKKVVAFNG
ncbi:MAG: sodium:solute symporter family protein [Armatimonadota bacterium]|nr:sodium:solute symporter family protein [Armatimonadota bacterium]